MFSVMFGMQNRRKLCFPDSVWYSRYWWSHQACVIIMAAQPWIHKLETGFSK